MKKKYFIESSEELQDGLFWDEFDTLEQAFKCFSKCEADTDLFSINIPDDEEENHQYFLEHLDEAAVIAVTGEGYYYKEWKETQQNRFTEEKTEPNKKTPTKAPKKRVR